MSENDYGGSGGRSTLMVDGWKMAALQEIPDRHKTTESVREHVWVVLLLWNVAERAQTDSEWYGERAGAATHLFLTKRMAASTSSMMMRTLMLIPAIFTIRSVRLAGSGMTSGSSVAPVNIAKKHMNTALAHSELPLKSSYSTRFV